MLYLSNRDGSGKTSEEGHYRLQTQVFTGDVLNSTAVQVTQNSPTGMSVLIAPGDFKIYSGNDYSYTGWNSTNEVVPITTADPANPRITTIVLYVDKGASTSASPPNNPGIIKSKAVNGTPAAVPTAPNGATIQSAVGAGNPYIILANVTVGTAVSTIINANISDQRQILTMATGLVGTAAIRDANVTTAKIADSNVTTAKIADLNVTTGKIANNAVTAAKIETQQAYIAPSMQNGWVNYDANHSQCGYMKDSLGFVHFRGLIRAGSSGNIFVLPAGYRNTKHQHFPIVSNGVFAYVRIDISGQVTLSGYNNTWVSIDGVTFKADA